MKRLAIFVGISFLFLNGCSTSSPTTNPAPKEDVSVEESIKPDTVLPSSSLYEDGTISCTYDDTILKVNNFGNKSNLDYLWLATQIEDDEMSAFTDGNCIYVSTQKITFDIGNDFKDFPLQVTQSLFDGVFQQETDSSISNTNKLSDGTYEYTLSLPEYTCKGKILSASDSTITISVFRIHNDLATSLSNAFEECYDTISFTSSTNLESSNNEDLFSDLNRQAEELADSSKKITEGVLYDSISAVHPDVTIYDMGDSLSISINLVHREYEDDSINFFDVLSSICQSCALEDSYSAISFSMVVDGKLVSMLTLTSYESPNNFSSSQPIILVNEYEEIINNIYSTVFSQNDITNTFDNNLESLKEEYGIAY